MRIENSTSAIAVQALAEASVDEQDVAPEESASSPAFQKSATTAASSAAQNLVSASNLLLAQTETVDAAAETTASEVENTATVSEHPAHGVKITSDFINLLGIEAFYGPQPGQEISAEDAWLYQMPSAAESTARLQMVKGLMVSGMTSEEARDVLRSVLNSGQSAGEYLESQASATTATASSVTATPTVEGADTTPSVTISA